MNMRPAEWVQEAPPEATSGMFAPLPRALHAATHIHVRNNISMKMIFFLHA